jgi:hypothetical protein
MPAILRTLRDWRRYRKGDEGGAPRLRIALPAVQGKLAFMLWLVIKAQATGD